MKKIIAITLAVVTCFSFAACSNGANEEMVALKDQITKLEEKMLSTSDSGNQIVGEWIMSDEIDFDMIFNEDHTGTATQHETAMEKNFTWSYDEEADTYLVYIDGKSSVYFVKYVNENGTETLKYYDATGVRK